VQPSFVAWVTRLVHDHRARLCRVARAEGLAAEDALDCVQDAFHGFLMLPTARLLVEAPEDSAALLTVLARNHARNRRRRHDRAKVHDAEAVDALASASSSVEDVVAAAERYGLTVGCVATMTTIQRRVVDLRLLDDVANEDVAAELGLTPGHVAVLLHRAKSALRACVPS
jgi:RNA polymerase sigma-70 factor (ECF subfamily)